MTFSWDSIVQFNGVRSSQGRLAYCTSLVVTSVASFAGLKDG